MNLIQIHCEYTGYHGSSIARMEEASQRENLNSQISVVDQELSKTMGHITTRFNDSISYEVSASRHVIGYLHQKLFVLLFILVADLVLTGSAVQGEDALGPNWDAVLAAAGEKGPFTGDVCRRTDGSACKASSSKPMPGASLRQPSNSPRTTSIRLREKCQIFATLWILKIYTHVRQILANKARSVHFYRAVFILIITLFNIFLLVPEEISASENECA